MVKKILALVLSTAMAATLLTGCLQAKKAEQPAAKTETTKAAEAAKPAEATKAAEATKPAEPAKNVKVIKISNGVNEKHPAYLGGKKFEEVLEKLTNGRYDVQVYANAQLGDDVKATQDVRMGNLEAVVTSSSPIVGLSKSFMLFDLPFIFPNEKAADAIMDGVIGKKLADSLEPKGLKLLAYYENGFRQLTNSKKEVKTPEDMKGLKIRTMENPIHLAAFKALGANPTPMPFSEVFTAMQQHTIDGQENPIPTIYLQKFNEVQKYVTLTGHVYGPHIFLLNGDFWKSLSDEDKKAFEQAAKESAILNRQTNRQMNKDYVEELKKAGMTVTELTPDQLKAFQKAVEPVYAQFENEIGKDLITEFKAEIAKASSK